MTTQEKEEMVSQLRVTQIHFAWDRYGNKDTILPKLQMFNEISGWGYSKLSVFVLICYDTTIEQDLERVYTLRDMEYERTSWFMTNPIPPAGILSGDYSGELITGDYSGSSKILKIT